MDVPERFEQLMAFLGSRLPGPVDQQAVADGAIQFVGGDPPEVVALLTHASLTISEFAGVWETPFKFTAKPRRVGVLKWRRLPENALLDALSALIKGAREARLASFQICQVLRPAHRTRMVARRWCLPVLRGAARRGYTLVVSRQSSVVSDSPRSSTSAESRQSRRRASNSSHRAYTAVTSRARASARASDAAIASAPSL